MKRLGELTVEELTKQIDNLDCILIIPCKDCILKNTQACIIKFERLIKGIDLEQEVEVED